jgi:hypothetical protein
MQYGTLIILLPLDPQRMNRARALRAQDGRFTLS